MDEAKVTIGVRCYNAEKYIERCARSLFNQTYRKCDFLFVDDCSTDNTIDIIKKTILDYPDRIEQLRIIRRKENGNRASCLNTILDNINGDFFTLVDSDDYLEPNAIELFFKVQSSNDSDVVISEMKSIWKDYTSISSMKNFPTGKDLCLAQLGSKARWCICGSFIRSNLITNDIRCIPGANMGEDLVIEVRLTYKANKISVLHSPIYIYDRTNENSSMFAFREEFRRQFDENMDLLYQFFQDKGESYINAWYHTRVISLIEDVKLVCIAGGHQKFYEDRVKRIRKIEKRHKLFFPFSYKIIHSLLWCRPILNIIIKCNKR